MDAWVTGASGAWGGAVALDLLRRGYDVTALGRSDAASLGAWAERLGRRWSFVTFDLKGEPPPIRTAPDVFVQCAVTTDGDRDALVRANYLGPARLVADMVAAMQARGSGRIGVFIAQNARLGLAGLGDFSAAQGALWTWCEALQDELARGRDRGVTLTRVIPPRTASDTQRFVTERSGRSAKLHEPKATPLVDAILAGKRHAGRRPIVAALATALR